MPISVATVDRDAARALADAPKKANGTTGKIDAHAVGTDVLAVQPKNGVQPVAANAMVVDGKARDAAAAAVVMTGIPSDSKLYNSTNGTA